MLARCGLKESGRKIFGVALVLLLVAAGCVENQLRSYPGLANEGILALSTTNAFLGPNLFLARELEKSSFLYRFFQAKGAPTAIEITETQTHPPQILLFYPRDLEVYVARMQAYGANRQWITRGPYAITRDDFRALKSLQVGFTGEPIFELYGKPHRFRYQPDRRVARAVEPAVPVITPTPKPKPKPKPKGKQQVRPKVPQLDAMNPANFAHLSSDQQAILLSKGFAERTHAGDVIHTVKQESESLEAIANWYTGSAENLAAVAAANGVPTGAKLKVGQRLTIPLKLATRFKTMPVP